MKKQYRVNESELSNLQSMYEHLMCEKEEMEYGTRPVDTTIYERVEEVENLMDKAHCVGAKVDWETLKRIREIQLERQTIRYSRALENGASEREAGDAFLL